MKLLHSFGSPIGLSVGISALVLSLVSANGASAQAANSPFERSGFYVGVISGTAFSAGVDKFSQVGLTAQQVADAKTFLKVAPNSVSTYGALGGYRFKVEDQPIVLGAEADISGLGSIYHRSEQTYTTSNTDLLKGGTYKFSSGTTANYLATVRGTAGYLVTPNLNLYGTAGLAFGGTATSSKGSVTYTPTGSTTSVIYTPHGSKSADGYVVGAGGEYAISNTVLGRLEYLYVKVKGRNETYDIPGSTPGTVSISDKSSGQFSVIRLLLSYQF